MQVSEENFKTLQSDNILLLCRVAQLSEEVRTLTAEKNAAIAIINSDNQTVVSPWINEASAYFATHPNTLMALTDSCLRSSADGPLVPS